jgi:hypothetical protein
VGEAVARTFRRRQPIYELGGPRTYVFEDLLRTVARHAGVKPLLVPVPFWGWHALARVAELLPRPPLTRNQVELMRVDTIASTSMPGFDALGISPQPLEAVLELILSRRSRP